MASEPFDQTDYWVKRHLEFRGDPRSVGNAGKSVEENRSGEAKVIKAASIVADLIPRRSKVLDIGCGYGRIASCFCDESHEYYGIDIAPAAIEQAREREPRGNFVVGSAADQVSESGGFDLVCLLYVAVHFVDPISIQNLMKFASDSVSKNGTLVIGDEFAPGNTASPSHVRQRPIEFFEDGFSLLGLLPNRDLRKAFVDRWNGPGSIPPWYFFG